MAKKSAPSATKAIESELNAFSSPTSKLHRGIRKCLLELQVSSSNLDQLFAERRQARAVAYADFASKVIRTAQEGLEVQRALHEENQAIGDQDLVALSGNLLKVAEQQVKGAQGHEGATQVANATDALLHDWIQNLVTQSVQALRDDASLDRALVIGSGGLILAGATGGTSIAVAAAIGSAVLLAREVKANLTNAGRTSRRDRDAVREAAALQLMQIVARLCAEWHLILSVRS